MQQAKARMLDVEIQMEALAQFQLRLQEFGLVIASHLVGPARLHTPEDGDQSLFDFVLATDPLRLLLLGQSTAGQVGEGPFQRPGQLFGALADLCCQPGGKLLEVLAEHLGLVQVSLKYVTAIEIPKRSLQPEPVKGVKNSHDILLMPFYKRVKDAVGGSR